MSTVICNLYVRVVTTQKHAAILDDVMGGGVNLYRKQLPLRRPSFVSAVEKLNRESPRRLYE